MDLKIFSNIIRLGFSIRVGDANNPVPSDMLRRTVSQYRLIVLLAVQEANNDMQ
jgi:hypothetical protein